MTDPFVARILTIRPPTQAEVLADLSRAMVNVYIRLRQLEVGQMEYEPKAEYDPMPVDVLERFRAELELMPEADGEERDPLLPNEDTNYMG